MRVQRIVNPCLELMGPSFTGTKALSDCVTGRGVNGLGHVRKQFRFRFSEIAAVVLLGGTVPVTRECAVAALHELATPEQSVPFDPRTRSHLNRNVLSPL